MDNIKGRPWLIGQEWDGDTPSDFTNGAIDEVAFYDHNLTWEEIQKISTNGITVNKGKIIEYTYDLGGNITSKKETIYDPATGETSFDTTSYGYGDSNWKDKLTSYDGKTITYDSIGNPLTFDGYSYSWQKGRQLAGISGNGIDTSYKYNDEGIRTQKTVNGVTTTYDLEGDLVVYEESYNVSSPDTKFNKIYYTYTGDGSLVSMNLDGVEYYYIRNGQNDIIGLYDKNGVQVAAYTYDTWGKLVSIKDQNGNDVTDDSSSVGYQNPYGYRGYRYDTDTGMYYLQSRYYNPEIGRYLNADSQLNPQSDITGMNLFCYGGNNPVNTTDPTGHAFMFITAAIDAVVGAVVGGIVAAKQGKSIMKGALIGAVVGGLIGLGAGAAAGVILTGSAAASTATVMTGGGALITTISGGGLVAGGKMVIYNMSQAVSKAPQVFWSGGNLAKDSARKIAQDVGGKTLEMTKLEQYLEKTKAPIEMWKAASTNFANVANNAGSCVYSIQNSAGVGLRSIWATVEYPLLSSRNIIYGIASQSGAINIMP